MFIWSNFPEENYKISKHGSSYFVKFEICKGSKGGVDQKLTPGEAYKKKPAMKYYHK